MVVRYTASIVTCLAVLLIDIISKAIITQTLVLGESIPLIGSLSFTLIHNYGIAFGLAQHVSTSLLIIGALIVLIFLSYEYKHLATTALSKIALGMIYGGAIGNIIDRLRFGYVIDFINLGWWPAFNIADTAKSIGAILLLIAHFRTDTRTETRSKTSDMVREHTRTTRNSKDLNKSRRL